MKKILAAILAMILMLSCAYAQEPGLTQFTAMDVDGNEWTEAIFADYDLTMVQIWATWCMACVSDVPRLVNLKNRLPENVNLITICDDGEYESELLRDISVEKGANYITLMANTEIKQELIDAIGLIPATVFVDSMGNIVGEIQYGAPSITGADDAYMQLIEEHLALLEA